MPNTDKIFRDPLYNYIAIDKVRDAWVLELIDTPEVQRLRRIHQLGVSHFTYPGADHTRLCHTLGVLNLMQHSCRRVEAMDHGPDVERARHSLLAAAVLHDVGHGPFTDMLKAKDGDFFISDWLRNRNTVEFLGIWESVFNPDFNYGEFAIIRSQAGLNNYKISVKEWVEKTSAIGLKATAGRYGGTYAHPDIAFEFGRLKRLNQIAIRQMQTLTDRIVKRLPKTQGGEP